MPLSPSYTLGLVFILCVSLIWAAASVLVQFVYSDKVSFDSPFLLTYTGVSLFTCFLPLQWLHHKCFPTLARDEQRLGAVSTDDDDNDDVGYESIPSPPAASADNHLEEEDDAWGLVGHRPSRHHWTTRDHYRAAAKIAPVWFLSNYAYGASLKYTSITSSTVLASTGSLFTFLFALMAKDEHFTWYKFFGIVLGMTGSILTGLHDIETKDNETTDNELQLWGDCLGLLSAVGYGGYAMMVRLLCPRDESLMSMQLFLGFVGLWNFVLLSPIAMYQGFFQDTGLTWFVFGCLLVKGLLDNVLSDYLWARAVVLTSATVATVGLGLTIPLAFASDVVMGRPNVMDTASVVGAVSVLCGFVLVNLGQQQEESEETAAATPSPPDQVLGVLSRQVEAPSMSHDDLGGISHMSLEYRDEPEANDDDYHDS